jgi:Ni,Fe-hydrogenase III small subunit/NAD-dependent dihydropyrimidine dehydrogenase PreA subunit
MLDSLKVLLNQGKQFIPNPLKSELPINTSYLPIIENKNCAIGCNSCVNECPSNAINIQPVEIDIGKCVFCDECQKICPEKIVRFTNQHRIASNSLDLLKINASHNQQAIELDEKIIREEIRRCFGRSLKLRLVSNGSCNGCELELNASGNVNFDIGRYGVEFVASPRHADGLVVTGAMVKNSEDAMQNTWDAIPDPKVFILAGTCAISGGVFADSPALRRDFLNQHQPDLYIPGCPPHPLTIVDGIMKLIRRK